MNGGSGGRRKRDSVVCYQINGAWLMKSHKWHTRLFDNDGLI